MLAVVFLGAAALPAHADPAGRSEARARRGLAVGASVGAGMLSPDCDGCDAMGGPAADFHLGWMVTPRLSLQYDGSAVVHTGDGFGSEASLVMAAAGQYWAQPRLWIKPGIGIARLESRRGLFGQDEDSAVGFGALAAVGYEVYRAGRFTFDLHGRVTAGFYSDGRIINTAIQLGANWY